MSDFLDRAKDLAKDLSDKARDAVSDNSEKIDDGIDKAAEFVDDKTKGKYSDKIDSVQAKAHDVVGRIADKGDGGTPGTPPPPTPPGARTACDRSRPGGPAPRPGASVSRCRCWRRPRRAALSRRR